jgi:hypothetical protein
VRLLDAVRAFAAPAAREPPLVLSPLTLTMIAATAAPRAAALKNRSALLRRRTARLRSSRRARGGRSAISLGC